MKKKNIIMLLVALLCFVATPVLAVNKVSCGDITNMPVTIPRIFTFFINFMQILVPILLIIFGMLDFSKAVGSGKDDSVKKSKNIFIKRVIFAAIVYFVIAIVEFLISVVADAAVPENGELSEAEKMLDCIQCFVDYKEC